MAAKDRAAPAFVKEYYLSQIRRKDMIEAELERVRASFYKEAGLDIPLPVPDFERTRPDKFPAKSKIMVIYVENTQVADVRQPAHGSLEDVDFEPGQAGYESSIRVEYFCRGGTPIGGLKGYEVLNIQCQNTVWAAYNTVINVAEKTSHDISLEGGLVFDNIRGEKFPLMEWGMFRFYPTVRNS